MHIRIQTFKNKDGRIQQGQTVALLRYAYNEEKKRSKQVTIATLDRWIKELPPEVDARLTDAEREEWQQWVAERDRELEEDTQRDRLLHVVENMGWAAKALLAGEKPDQPERIWDALDVLTKALEQARYPRPTRGRGRPLKTETPTPDDLIASPYDDPMLVAEMKAAQQRIAALPDFTSTARTRKGDS